MGELTRRKFIHEKDYEMLTKWWVKHGCDNAPDQKYLSKNGIIVEVDKNPTALVFMYGTDSGICMAEFFTVNPKAKKIDREKALTYLIESTKEWGKNAGYSLIYVSTYIKKYIKRLKEQGFFEAKHDMKHCFYEVR